MSKDPGRVTLEQLPTDMLAAVLAARGFLVIAREGMDALPHAVFKDIAQTCQARNLRWHGPDKPGYTVFERAAEVAEEAGEVLKEAKRLRRMELGMTGNRHKYDRDELRGRIEYESGDVLVTLINLNNMLGTDLYAGLLRAFNERSAELGFQERL